MNTNHVYTCINRRCRKYHREWQSVSPAEYRALTMRSLSCTTCGQVARLVRVDLGRVTTTETNNPFEPEVQA